MGAVRLVRASALSLWWGHDAVSLSLVLASEMGERRDFTRGSRGLTARQTPKRSKLKNRDRPRRSRFSAAPRVKKVDALTRACQTRRRDKRGEDARPAVWHALAGTSRRRYKGKAGKRSFSVGRPDQDACRSGTVSSGTARVQATELVVSFDVANARSLDAAALRATRSLGTEMVQGKGGKEGRGPRCALESQDRRQVARLREREG